MTVVQLTADVNMLCDENYTATDMLTLFNNAVAYINVEFPAAFPFVVAANVNTDYAAIPERFMRTAIVYYCAWQVKMKEDETSLADRFLQLFRDAFASFKMKYTVPTAYQVAVADSTNVVLTEDSTFVLESEW